MITVEKDGTPAAKIDTYKGTISAGCLSVLTAALFVLRSKASSSTCDEVVLLYSEVLKLAAAILFCALRGDLKRLLYQPQYSVFPTISYMCISLLTYWALPHMDASVAAFISQIKLPATALFSYLLLTL